MRYVITGGSGYIGSRLVDLLSRREDTERIVICDLVPPGATSRRPSSSASTCATATAVRALLERARRRTRWCTSPSSSTRSHDEQLMYDVDVNGTHNVLAAASQAGTQQVLVTSSASAYGAFPDNPEPLTEDDPVRGVSTFSYARDKTESDRLCQLWAANHPDRTMTIVRPCIVFGPERRQLPRAALDQAAVRRSTSASSTTRSSSCTRTTWSRR